MRALLLLLLALAPLASAQGVASLNFFNDQGATATIPNAPPFSSLGSFRWEFRLHGFQLNQPNLQRIFEVSNISVSLVPASTNLRVTNFLDGGGESLTIDLAGRSDVVVRIQRDLSRKRMTLQIWDSDGANFAETAPQPLTGDPRNFAGPLTIGKNSFDFERLQAAQLAYFRWYQSLVAYQAAPPANVAGGDLADFEFENTIADTSGRNLPLAFDQATNYNLTPVIALLPRDFSVRASSAFSIDASPSAAASYFWQQLSGPDVLTFSSRTSAIPTVTGAVAFGTYVIQLRVTGASGNSAIRQVKVGAVPTNREGVVQVADDKVDFIIGPQLRDGVSPWPFYDRIRKDTGHLLGRAYAPLIAADFDSPVAGTISVVNGSTTISGTGTAFRSVFSCDGREEFAVLSYPDGAGGFGRRLLYVSSCPSDTEILTNVPYAYASAAGVQFQRWDASVTRRWSEGLNYYDSALVQYQNYYRTGIDDFLTYARTLADGWWRIPQIDGGRDPNSRDIGFMPPRRVSLAGLLLRSMEGKPEYLTWLKAHVDVSTAAYLEGLRASPTSEYGQGVREPGYSYLHIALMAKAHPDASVRTAYLALLNDYATSFWYDYQCRPDNAPNRCLGPLGAYRWPDPGFYGGNAEVPFHVAIAMEGIARAHLLTGNSTLATVIERFSNHIATDLSGGQPIWQTAVSGFDPQVRCQAFQYWVYATPGGPETNESGNQTAGASCPNYDAVRDNRSVNNEFPFFLGYAYRDLRLPIYQDLGDDVFAATFGQEQGPRTDGFYGRVDTGFGDLGKQYGQSLRSSGSYLASRLNSSTQPIYLTLFVGFSLAAVPGATSVRLTAYSPNGREATADCTAAPCAVQADRIQGDHRLRLEYRSATGKVLAATNRLYAVVAP